ncbi:MAG: hypothetical protein FPO08_12920 [Geobacter sp.]|nr:MAG: hypothetical protein FPO08_12920 [Geobacter sp.]
MQDLDTVATAGRDALSLGVKGDNNSIIFNSIVMDDLRSVLQDEFSDKKYTVLLCGPRQNDNENTKKIFELLVSELEKQKIDLVLGGNEAGLGIDPDEAYPHVEEANYVRNSKCNSVIVFASDCTTYSQLSLLTYAKTLTLNDSIDIVVVPNVSVLEEHPYILTGPFKMVDNFGKVFELSKLNKEGVDDIVDRIKNRRMLFYQQRRGRKRAE